jgi:hypothetical protein
MTRTELEEFLTTHTIYEIAEFIIQRQVERYSDGFDAGYEIGKTDGKAEIFNNILINEINGEEYYWNWGTQKWTKKDMDEVRHSGINGIN